MFWVVFRSFAKKKEMVRGDKKSNRTTNLDFPSVLLNQGLTEANNNTKREETAFSQTTRRKKRKKERRKERKRDSYNFAESSTRRRLFARQHIRHKTTFGERTRLHTTRETTRVYKNTITNDEIVTTPEENKHRSLFETSAKREGGKRSLKSARDLDLDVPIDRMKKFKRENGIKQKRYKEEEEEEEIMSHRNSYEDLSLKEMGDRATTPTYWKTEEEWLTKHHPSALLLNDDDENGIEGREEEEKQRTNQNNSLIAKLKKQLKSEGKQLVVFLDYDGTLSPIVSQPEKAFMSEETRRAVQTVAKKFPTAIVSGRAREKVYDFVKLDELYYAGSHGLDIAGPKGSPDIDYKPCLWAEDVMQNVFETLKKKLDSIKGAVVETNVFCVSAHYRQCENEEDEAEVEKAVDEIVAQNKDKLRKHSGKKVWEVKPKVDWDKGKALSYLLEALKLNDRKDVISMYLGDDVTDEDAFEVLRKLSDDETQGDGVGIVVTKVPKQTKASYSLRDTDEVLQFLTKVGNIDV